MSFCICHNVQEVPQGAQVPQEETITKFLLGQHHVIAVARQSVKPYSALTSMEDGLLSGWACKNAFLRWAVLARDAAQHYGCSCIGERVPIQANFTGKQKRGSTLSSMCSTSSKAGSNSLWIMHF
eukprot:3680490-Ditylum_brightwellii.AAC.1